MSLTYQIESRTPILTEMFFILIVGAGFTVNMTNFDINQHFYYVLPDQSYCNNTRVNDPFCIGLWNTLGLPVGDQADIPNKYWENLNITTITFGALLALSRFAGTFILSRALKISLWHHLEKIYKIFVYGVTVTIMPLFSYGDYLYYVLQGKALPLDWRWLDGIGVYPFILRYTHEQHVSTTDVYITMVIGGLIAFAVWIPLVIEFKKTKGVVKQLI